MALKEISYSNCWEDADTLLSVFPDLRGSNFLSIASAGDNSISMLLANPDLVIAVDRSESQVACANLKKTVIKYCTYDQTLRFLGVKYDSERLNIYSDLRTVLPLEARRYWDTRTTLIAKGIIHCGRLESFFSAYRTFILPLLAKRKHLLGLFEDRTRDQRQEYYRKTLYSRVGFALFRIFFSRFIMGRFGRRPELYQFVNDYGVDDLIERIEHGLIELPTHDNPYLRHITLGDYGSVLPLYLRESSFDTIKQRIDKLIVVKSEIIDYLKTPDQIKFSGFNLSDIFEYMSIEGFREVIEQCLVASENRARLFYWNFLVLRNAKQLQFPLLHSLDGLSKSLGDKSTTFFYRALNVEEIELL